MVFALLSVLTSAIGIYGFWNGMDILLYAGTILMILINYFSKYKLSKYKLIGGISTTLLIMSALIMIGIPWPKAISICLCYENIGIICATAIFKMAVKAGNGVKKENG